MYEIAVDREKNLILAIMKNVTHISLREKLDALQIDFEFSEPFQEDTDKRWSAIGKLRSDGIASIETAVKLLGLVDNPSDEIKSILEEKRQRESNNNSFNENGEKLNK
ncbi:phage portal protein [Parabacteroides chongii]|uniref:phage portal protein n=1 Tax=Parabacteroides chongii TaxID=2685834 RepID=UPI0031F409A9